MIEALTTLSDEAAGNGGEVFCALYEFQDPEVIDHLAKLQDKANVILSNMPGTTDGTKTNDTYNVVSASIIWPARSKRSGSPALMMCALSSSTIEPAGEPSVSTCAVA